MEEGEPYIIIKFKEKWKFVKEYPDYKISNYGRVKRVEVNRLLKPGKIHCGYLYVVLFKNKKKRNFYIHRLVTETFIGPCPKNKEVNHIDGNKENNKVWNLEYITRSENIKHAYKLGLLDRKGENNTANKLYNEDVRKIRRLYCKGLTQEKIAKKFKTSRENISLIVNYKAWSHID